MLLKSSTVQLAQPIENDDEIFLLHCGEAKAFMGRGCNHGINHSLWEMYQQHIFIKADVSNKTERNRQQPTSPKQVRRFGWTRFIKLTTLLSVVIGAIWLISKMVTSQVVTVVSVIAGFLILRFIVRVILKVTFTLLSILFWLAILCAILLCVL